MLTLRGVNARCVAGGASNFWIVGHEAAEPMLTGDFPITGMSPTAYFVLAPNFNYLPVCGAARVAHAPKTMRLSATVTRAWKRRCAEVYG